MQVSPRLLPDQFGIQGPGTSTEGLDTHSGITPDRCLDQKKKKTSFTRNGLDPSKGPLRTSCVRTEEVSSQCRNLRG